MSVFVLQMLKSTLSAWDKKGGKYAFINVSQNVKKSLQAVFSADVQIISPSLPVVESKVSFGNQDVLFSKNEISKRKYLTLAINFLSPFDIDDGAESLVPDVRIE